MTNPLDFRILEHWWKSSNHDGAPQPHGAPQAPWLAQLDRAGISRNLTYPTTTLARLLDQTADRFGASPALIYMNKQWTYRELLAQVNRFAGGLATLGVRRGDRVLITLPNCPEFVTAFFAVQKLGAIVVNAGPLMGADDLQQVMTMTTPRVVIGLDLQSPMLRRAAHGSTIEHSVWVSLQLYQPVIKRLGYQIKLWQRESSNGDGIEHITFPDLLAQAPSRPPTIEPDPTQVAVLQPTGGTTGTLKLVQLTHQSILANATQTAVWMGSRQGQERHLAVLPLFHVYGLQTCLICPIYTGASIILSLRFAASDAIELARQYQPTLFPLVPAICDAISNLLEKSPGPAKLGDVRLCVSGAAPLPQPIAERFKRLTGAVVVEGYGLTEASPVTHVNPPGNPRTGSIGLPMPDTRVRIIDLDNGPRDAKPGEPGELWISGPQVMLGYFANPEETRKALFTDAQGAVWLRTGDIVRYDEDGYFYVLDRKKDMIIRSGLKVYPLKVENVLRRHAQVADVAVIGRADEVHTEVVVAYIVRNQASANQNRAALAEELRSLCRQHLAVYEGAGGDRVYQ
jgi:long-chain acyl-CoA synthetase